MILSRHNQRRHLRAILTSQADWGQIADKGRKAIEASSGAWDPESDLKIRLMYDGPPISIKHTGFKSIDVGVNMPLMMERCIKFIRQKDVKETLVVAGQAVYSTIRLWVGHYDHCPYDSWRHQSLYIAAAKGGFGTTAITPQQRELAEAVTAFFEISIVALIISRKEGNDFAKGLLYEHFINSHCHNLLTNLFFLGQLLAASEAWQIVLREFHLPNDPLAEALLPEVLKPLFGLHIIRNRNSSRTVPYKPHRHTSWSQRVYRLAEILIPYLCEAGDESSSEPYRSVSQSGFDGLGGQLPNLSDIGGQILEQMSNPFISADDNSQQPQGSLQLGVSRPGQSSPPIPRCNIEELDRYYSQRASAVIVETQSSNKEESKEPKLLQVGFLDSEEAPISALVTGQIDWFKMRCVPIDGQNQLKLFRRSDPLEIPLGGDESVADGPPHLLLLVDSSSSMGFNPMAPSPNGRGKYDLVLLACYGIFKHIELNRLTDNVQVACINFSGRSIESGWRPFSSIDKVKTVLLTYQAGGTTLSPDALRRAFNSRPGNFLAIAITDGEIGNVAEAVSELRKVVESKCDLILLHVGQPNVFTKTVKEMNCPVHILNSSNDLVGLSLRIAKERFKCQSL